MSSKRSDENAKLTTRGQDLWNIPDAVLKDFPVYLAEIVTERVGPNERSMDGAGHYRYKTAQRLKAIEIITKMIEQNRGGSPFERQEEQQAGLTPLQILVQHIEEHRQVTVIDRDYIMKKYFPDDPTPQAIQAESEPLEPESGQFC